MELVKQARQFRSFLMLLWATFTLAAFWLAICWFVAQVLLTVIGSIGEGL